MSRYSIAFVVVLLLAITYHQYYHHHQSNTNAPITSHPVVDDVTPSSEQQQQCATTTTSSTPPPFSSIPQKMSFFSHLWNHGTAASVDNSKYTPDMGTIYQFTTKDADGNDFNFADQKGKVLLITNTACACGFTKSGFEHMVNWHNAHKDDPFEIIAFPSNSFNQEKRDGESIKKHLAEKFEVNFPLMDKSDVNGDERHPVYTWMLKTFPGDITWNFSAYFLINHQGIPIARFEKESWEDISKAIAAAVQDAKADPAKL